VSNFIPLPPTYAVSDPQVRAVLDVLARNMQVVIDATPAASTSLNVGGGSTFGSPSSTTNVTNIGGIYTLDTLTADLKRGAAEVITGALNGTTVMKLEPAGQYVVFQHKDAIVLGNTGAYSGTVRTALGITSTGILGGYNRTSDGEWQTTFAIESATGNLTVLGTIRANSIIQVGAYLGTQTVSSVLSDVNSAYANAAAAQAAVTAKLNKSAADILSGDIRFTSGGGFRTDSISIDSSGNATGDGVAFTSKGIVGRTSSGTTFTLDATTGAATFKGNITGGANINITGNGIFNGLTAVPGGDFSAVSANTSNSAKFGVYAESSAATGAAVFGFNNNTSSSYTYGVFGEISNPNSAAVYGYNYSSTGGFGVQGQANGSSSTGGLFGGNTGVYGAGTYGAGVKGLGLLAGYGLECINGFRWGSYTMAQPTGSATDVLKGNGSWGAVSITSSSVTSALGYTPLPNTAQAADSAALGGYAPSSWARIFATNSGNANAGGSGINLLGSTSTGIAGAYVGTAGSGNIVTFTVQTTSPSDIRLKEEVQDIDVGLAFVNRLRPVSYKLKADPRHQKGYGFIADEVQQLGVYGTSLVYEEPDWQVGDQIGFKTVHYPSYVAVLTKAIQELSREVELLKAKG